QRYGDEQGVPEDGVEAAASEVAGSSLADFFARTVHAPVELDFGALAHVGLEVRRRPRESSGDKGGTPAKEKSATPKAWLGAVTKSQNDRCLVGYAPAGSPAHVHGLYADDELVALDGWRIEPDKLNSRVEEYVPGSRVKI